MLNVLSSLRSCLSILSMKDVVFFFSYSMLPYIFAYISFMLCNGRHKVKRNLNGLNNEKDYLYFTGVGKPHRVP